MLSLLTFSLPVVCAAALLLLNHKRRAKHRLFQQRLRDRIFGSDSGNARLSVESSGSRVTHFTKLSSV